MIPEVWLHTGSKQIYAPIATRYSAATRRIPANWPCCWGSPTDLPKKNGGIEHTVAMVLLDRKGRIIRRDESLEDEAGQLKALQSAITDAAH